jgi:hypothetical protein
MNLLKTTAAAAAICFCASSASAALLNYTTGTGQGGNNVSSPIGQSNVWAGSFNMTETAVGSEGSLGLGDSFVAFCMDILTTMQQGQEYKINNTTPFANTSGDSLSESLGDGGSTRMSLVQNLFDSAYGTLSGNPEFAAFGLAIWELTHETAGTAAASLDVTIGNFSVLSSVASTANGFLDDAVSYVGGRNYALNFLENVRGVPSTGGAAQNLVMATVVPLPAAGLLLFGAIGALGVASRRKKAA